MNKTLLDVVQTVLIKLDLDPVNSINESEDALAVAREAETTYYDLMSRADWPDQKDLVDVESVSDVNNPTALRLAKEVSKIESLRYDVTTDTDNSTVIKRIHWLEPEEFLKMVYSRNDSSDNVDVVNYKGHKLFVYNNVMPTYYTSFDNETLILDSYDNTESTTLIGSKAVCTAVVLDRWEFLDDFRLPLKRDMYSLFLSELSAAASLYLNGVQSPQDEMRRMRGISRLRRESIRTEAEYFPRNNFGRKGNGRA